MTIDKIHIRSFGKIRDITVTFNRGINTFINENSYGKTTVVNFIRAMLYGMDYRKAGGAEVSAKTYMPWNSKDKFGGWMEFSHNNRSYRVERYFGASQRSEQCTLYDLTNGEVINCDNIGERFLGLSEQSFVQCMYIGQENITVQSNSNLEEKLAGMVQGGDDNNYDSAMKQLENYARKYKLFRGRGGLISETEDRLQQATEQLRQARSQRQLVNSYRNRIDEIDRRRQTLLQQYDSAEKQYQKLNVITSSEFTEKDVEKERRKAVLEERIKKQNVDKLQQDIATVNSLMVNSVQPIAENPFRKIAFWALAVLMVLVGIALFVFVDGSIKWAGVFAFLAGICFAVASLIMDKKLRDVAQKRKQNDDKITAVFTSYGLQVSGSTAGLEAMYSLQQKWLQDQTELDLLKTVNQRDSYAKERLEMQSLYQSLQQLKSDIRQLDEERGRLSHAVDSDNSDVSACQDVVNNLNQQLAEMQKKWQAAISAMEYMKQAKEEMSDAYIPAINSKCGRLLSTFSNGRLTGVTVNKDFEIFVTEQGETHPLSVFSKGIRELTLFCFKMVLSEIVYGDHIPFVIIDDAFVNLDDKNFNGVVSLLRSLSKSTQIIYMTCHQRGKLMCD